MASLTNIFFNILFHWFTVCHKLNIHGSVVKNSPAMQETWVNPWVGRIPWRGKQQPTPVSLPGKSHGQRSLGGLQSMGSQELDMT